MIKAQILMQQDPNVVAIQLEMREREQYGLPNKPRHYQKLSNAKHFSTYPRYQMLNVLKTLSLMFVILAIAIAISVT